MTLSLVWLTTACLSGVAFGFFVMYRLFKQKHHSFQALGKELLQRAEKEAEKIKEETAASLKQKEYEHQRSLGLLFEQKLNLLTHREEKLDRQISLIDKKGCELEKKEQELALKERELEKREQESVSFAKQCQERLRSIAKLNHEEAKAALLAQLSEELVQERAAFILKQKNEIEREADKIAAEVVTTAICRLTTQSLSEPTVLTVAFPSPEMKGRIIGREGRNIRALEQATGMNFLIDDTPNAIVISGCDPIRKEVARVALKDLLQDGRIHPTRIEEAVAKAEKKIESEIKTRGEEAALQTGVLPLQPELAYLLGKLHFCHSMGQNGLNHSLEVCQLMGCMAAELKLNVPLAKRIGLLHDIGKAASMPSEGSHALIGQEIALKQGECVEVANGIGAHHDEIVPFTLEAALCSVANKISASRPGARSESLELHLKRSAKLEQICKQFTGVERAFAMHAGREVRVLVEPDHFDDGTTLLLAREIAKKIENELIYPGKIKVTVIREKRAVEYAT